MTRDASPFFQAELGLSESEAELVQGSVVIAPFAEYCERQPPGSNWCWAAVSRAMLGFSKSVTRSLQQIAAAMRDPPLRPDEPFNIPTALDLLNVPRSAAMNLYQSGLQLAPEAITNGTPVAATIAWFAPNGFEPLSHVIALFGWDPQRGNLLVFDPNTVGLGDDIIKSVPIGEMNHYLEGAESKKRGTWGDGYRVIHAG